MVSLLWALGNQRETRGAPFGTAGKPQAISDLNRWFFYLAMPVETFMAILVEPEFTRCWALLKWYPDKWDIL